MQERNIQSRQGEKTVFYQWLKSVSLSLSPPPVSPETLILLLKTRREKKNLIFVLVQFCRYIEIQNQLQWFAVMFVSAGCIANVMASGPYLPLFLNGPTMFTLHYCILLLVSGDRSMNDWVHL